MVRSIRSAVAGLVTITVIGMISLFGMLNLPGCETSYEARIDASATAPPAGTDAVARGPAAPASDGAGPRGTASTSVAAVTVPHVDHHMAEAVDVVTIQAASPLANEQVPHALLHPGAGDPSVCICDWARDHNGWCEKCRAGYVCRIAVPSAILFTTLDPHGHEISHDSIQCASCQAAIATDGWCEPSRIGWQDGLAWMTRITWVFSKGVPAREVVTLCERCRAVAASDPPQPGPWCAVCSGRVVAGVFFVDDGIAREAATRLGILEASIVTLPRCEMCACAMVYDDECPDCRIRYRDGRPVNEGASASAR